MSHPLSTSDIKLNNRRLVLNSIFSAGTTSRTRLAKELHMSKPAVSDNLSPLLDCGIVTEAGEGDSGPSGGRKQILLKFNPDNRYIISIDLSSSSVIFALSNLNGNILNTFEVSVQEDTSPAACLNLLCSGIRVLQQASVTDIRQIYCIAVAAPGSFSEESDLISCNIKCGCPPWYQLDLKKELSQTFALPVLIYNNIKAAALGEYIRGACTERPNTLFLSTGLGIGIGILLDGRIFLGEDGNAGEVYDYMDYLTPGQNFESVTCLPYLRRRCGEASAFRAEPTLPRIVEAYQQKDPEIMEIIREICSKLARMVYNHLNFISLHSVCFAGEYAPFFETFRQELLSLYQNSTRPAPVICQTALQKLGSTAGMLYLARQNYFEDLCSR